MPERTKSIIAVSPSIRWWRPTRVGCNGTHCDWSHGSRPFTVFICSSVLLFIFIIFRLTDWLIDWLYCFFVILDQSGVFLDNNIKKISNLLAKYSPNASTHIKQYSKTGHPALMSPPRTLRELAINCIKGLMFWAGITNYNGKRPEMLEHLRCCFNGKVEFVTLRGRERRQWQIDASRLDAMRQQTTQTAVIALHSDHAASAARHAM